MLSIERYPPTIDKHPASRIAPPIGIVVLHVDDLDNVSPRRILPIVVSATGRTGPRCLSHSIRRGSPRIAAIVNSSPSTLLNCRTARNPHRRGASLSQVSRRTPARGGFRNGRPPCKLTKIEIRADLECNDLAGCRRIGSREADASLVPGVWLTHVIEPPGAGMSSVLECERRLLGVRRGGFRHQRRDAPSYRPLGCYLRRYRLGTAKHVAVECSRESCRVARVP